jgi:phosphoglycerol transferase MdoB-like AlkP superfamily enzyme
MLERTLVLLLFMSFCRLLFLLFNYSYFNDHSFLNLLKAFVFGLRFDLTITVILGLPFLFFHLNGFPSFYKRPYQILLKILYLIPAVFMLLMNCIDIGLFRFAGKRITADVFSIMSFGNDMGNTVPGMVMSFWYLLVILFVLIWLLNFAYNRISLHSSRRVNGASLPISKLRKIIYHLLAVVIIFISFRGGLQYKPVNILTAAKYGTGPYASLVLNSPFTYVKTFGKSSLQEVHFFDQESLDRIYSPIKLKRDSAEFSPLNVILLIMEGVGKEYIGKLSKEKSYTPFLDSLIEESLVFPNCFANGKRSIEGIPAILSGIPALMSEPFITSAYSGNSFNSLPSMLKSKGYYTAFYHGGTNGTMGFDNFSKSAGFDLYFGRKEYANEADFDGSWGVYDEPFLLRFASDMNKAKQPFFSCLFTISSHHPYSIPEKLKNTFSAGTLPIHQSVQYTDYSLRSFFKYASEQDWYQNTLFVITTDHTALAEHSFYFGRVGMYAIPQIFYRPDGSLKAVDQRVTQQIDIYPSILDYLNFDRDYFAFGSSVFDSTSERFAINYINDTYQFIQDDYSLILDTLQGNILYNYAKDHLLRENLITKDSIRAQQMEKKLKAFIQVYNNALIGNKMTY